MRARVRALVRVRVCKAHVKGPLGSRFHRTQKKKVSVERATKAPPRGRYTAFNTKALCCELNTYSEALARVWKHLFGPLQTQKTNTQ